MSEDMIKPFTLGLASIFIMAFGFITEMNGVWMIGAVLAVVAIVDWLICWRREKRSGKIRRTGDD